MGGGQWKDAGWLNAANPSLGSLERLANQKNNSKGKQLDIKNNGHNTTQGIIKLGREQIKREHKDWDESDPVNQSGPTRAETDLKIF